MMHANENATTNISTSNQNVSVCDAMRRILRRRRGRVNAEAVDLAVPHAVLQVARPMPPGEDEPPPAIQHPPHAVQGFDAMRFGYIGHGATPQPWMSMLRRQPPMRKFVMW
jgi:hypothetical protein